MGEQQFLDGKVTLHAGDCLEVLAQLPDNSVDSCVCDPPYHLTSIVKRFGAENAAPAKAGKTGAYARASAGFMGKQWDGGDVAFQVETWAQVFRVLKPGGHIAAFSGTRTYHRMVCAIEDAGFEVRDQIGWAFGSGFPKSHDVSKGIDRTNGEAGRVQKFTAWMRSTGLTAKKLNHVTGTFMGSHYLTDKTQAAIPTRELFENIRPLLTDVPPWVDELVERVQAEREVVGRAKGAASSDTAALGAFNPEYDATIPATEAAKQWEGWGTALKPAWEPIVLARKPLIGTIAANVLEHGTGALNIDGCRVEGEKRSPEFGETLGMVERSGSLSGPKTPRANVDTSVGRWPANLIHDGSEEVLAAFPETADSVASMRGERHGAVYGGGKGPEGPDTFRGHSDAGSAARFFYTAKADAEDRLGSKHPTVKPLDLMQWLVRLVTPKGGVVLDPFAGTGTTGEAAWREGMRAILIEREEEYLADIGRRMELASNPTKRAAVAKTKNNLERPEDLPLFAR